MTIRGRRVFVGRVAERALIEGWLDDAMSGNPHIVMIGGEPGIGKSALCREVARDARRRGMRVCSGQCYEQGSLKLPYLPFAEAIEPYVREAGANHAWDEAALVGRIVPGLRTGGTEPSAGAEGESPYQLFEAVAGFLRRMGGEQPSVLVLEDLHDADAGTLGLLAHLGRRLGLARVVVVATYRDSELDPSQPLAATLAGLQRAEIAERIILRGLDVPDLQELYERMTGASPARGFCESLRSQTEGNPLFATETIRHLDAEGLLGDGSEAALRAVPAGLRDVVGRRLLGLSPATRELLSVAAVLGREFRLDVLERMPGVDRACLAEALGEARASRVVEEFAGGAAGVAYRFNHALFRQYLYEGLTGARRRSVHVDAGNALEALQGSSVAHADVIAEHLAHSSDPRNLERASRLSEEAARRALSVYAFADAARITRRALESFQRAGGEERERRCELLLLLAEALNQAAEPRQALDGPIEEAYALAEAAGDELRATRAALLGRDALRLALSGRVFFPAEDDRWARRLDRHALAGTRERVIADLWVALKDFEHQRIAAGDRPFERARDLAWQIGDVEACWLAGSQRVILDRRPDGDSDRKATIEALLALPRSGVSPRVLDEALTHLFTALTEFGDRARAEQVHADVSDLARLTGALATRVNARRLEYQLAVMDGHLEAALQALIDNDEKSEASGLLPAVGNRAANFGRRATFLLGRPRPPATVLSADDEREERAIRAIVEREHGSPEGPFDHWSALATLQRAIRRGDRQLVEARIKYFDGTLQVTSDLTLVNRVLGEAEAFVGHPAEARSLFVRGLEQAKAMRFRPEVALTRTALAALLVDHYPAEVDDARRHLQAAIPELREMGMRRGLERAEVLAGRIAGQGAHAVGRPAGLTGREVEVLRLIASGRTNREISAELVLSERTVGRHITNIYGKIGARGKADATAFALRQSLS